MTYIIFCVHTFNNIYVLFFQSTDPYLYIFNTKVANEAANTVTSDKVPSIILYHQSFLGNCKLYPSEDQTSLPFPSFNEKLTSSVPSVSSPQTSVTTIQLEKTDNTVLKTSPSGANIKNEPMYGENTSTINLREMKPASMPTSADMFLSQSMPAVNDPSIMQVCLNVFISGLSNFTNTGAKFYLPKRAYKYVLV